MSTESKDPTTLFITKAWTKAGISSCVKVQGATKQDDFLFDCGYFSSDTTSSKFVLISHGHIDHVGSCIAHARARGLGGSPATYFVPSDIVDHLSEARAAFEKLDNAPIAMKLVGINPGDEFTIGSNLRVKAFGTVHRVPSQGYAVYNKRKGQLLPELKNLSGAEIKELKLMGQTILTPDTEELEMVYTGDTTMEGLIGNPENEFIFRARTFIMELTYLDGERSKAQEWGHIHIADVIENAHLFERVEQVVFVHISQKYSLSRILTILRSQLPEELLPKVRVSLHSFGAREHLTQLLDRRWDQHQQCTAGWGWTNAAALPRVPSVPSVSSVLPFSATTATTTATGSSHMISATAPRAGSVVGEPIALQNHSGYRKGSLSAGRNMKSRELNEREWTGGIASSRKTNQSYHGYNGRDGSNDYCGRNILGTGGGGGGRSNNRGNYEDGGNKYPRTGSSGRNSAPWAPSS